MYTVRFKLHGILSVLRLLREWIEFVRRSYSAPSPTLLKMKTLVRYSLKEGVWIETGTYLGGTTKYLAKRFPKVITIEPSPAFHNYARGRLRGFENVTLLFGTSEQFFEDALVSAAPIANLWLDGHYSEGGTFLGDKVSPIEEELEAVIRNKHMFKELVLFIDDVRLFPRSEKEETGYPRFQWLITWCEKHDFDWQIQNDILIAKSASQT